MMTAQAPRKGQTIEVIEPGRNRLRYYLTADAELVISKTGGRDYYRFAGFREKVSNGLAFGNEWYRFVAADYVSIVETAWKS